MSVPAVITLEQLTAAQDLLAHWRSLRIPLSHEVRADIEYNEQTRQLTGPYATYAKNGLSVAMDDASPEVLRRYARLLELVEEVNAGKALLTSEFRLLAWTADEEAGAA